MQIFSRWFNRLRHFLKKGLEFSKKFLNSFSLSSMYEKKIIALAKERERADYLYHQIRTGRSAHVLYLNLTWDVEDPDLSNKDRATACIMLSHLYREGIDKGEWQLKKDAKQVKKYQDLASTIFDQPIMLTANHKNYLNNIRAGGEHVIAYQTLLIEAESNHNEKTRGWCAKVLSFLYRNGFSRLGLEIKADAVKAREYVKKSHSVVSQFQKSLQTMVNKIKEPFIKANRHKNLLFHLANLGDKTAQFLIAEKLTTQKKAETAVHYYEAAANDQETAFSFASPGVAKACIRLAKYFGKNNKSDVNELKAIDYTFKAAQKGSRKNLELIKQKLPTCSIANLQMGLLELSNHDPTSLKNAHAYFNKAKELILKTTTELTIQGYANRLKQACAQITQMQTILEKITVGKNIDTTISNNEATTDCKTNNLLIKYRNILYQKLCLALADGFEHLEENAGNTLTLLEELATYSEYQVEAKFRIANLQAFCLNDVKTSLSSFQELAEKGDQDASKLEKILAANYPKELESNSLTNMKKVDLKLSQVAQLFHYANSNNIKKEASINSPDIILVKSAFLEPTAK